MEDKAVWIFHLYSSFNIFFLSDCILAWEAWCQHVSHQLPFEVKIWFAPDWPTYQHWAVPIGCGTSGCIRVHMLSDYFIPWFPCLLFPYTVFGSEGGVCYERGKTQWWHVTRGCISNSGCRSSLKHLDFYWISYPFMFHVYSLAPMCNHPISNTSWVNIMCMSCYNWRHIWTECYMSVYSLLEVLSCGGVVDIPSIGTFLIY